MPSSWQALDNHFLNSSKGGRLGRRWGQALTLCVTPQAKGWAGPRAVPPAQP